MADLVDLKYSPADVKEETAEVANPQPPQYPWGLQIRLENEELKKLGITKLPGVGDEWHMSVIAKVTGVSETTMADGDYDCCVTLQITMASIDLWEPADEEAGEAETPAAEMAEMRKIATLLTKYRG